jgi:hypothetical protein
MLHLNEKIELYCQLFYIIYIYIYIYIRNVAFAMWLGFITDLEIAPRPAEQGR